MLLLVIGVALGCLIRGVIKPKSNSSKEVETKKDSEELGTSQALIVLPMATSIEPSPSSDQVKVALQAERLRIKNALHDDTIQQLTAIKLKLEFILNVPKLSDVRLRGEIVIEDLERTIRVIRYFIEDLDDVDIAEKTMIELLREFGSKFSGFYFMRVFTYQNHAENTFPLTTREKTELMFIVKEAVQNAIKYSASGKCHIHPTWRPEELLMEIEDRGFGLPRSATKGYGLNSIEARAKSIGATVIIENLFGKGLLIKAILPNST